MPQKLQFETDCWDLAGLSDLPCKNLRHLSSLFHPPKLNNPIHPIRQCHHQIQHPYCVRQNHVHHHHITAIIIITMKLSC